ncbi:restriction endonuclease subunit S [Haliscomenobacter hydrossis]|uniref:Restriction modification system DNA specificity domain protein n=1 Tax=Haliscomenobacter hydrossis (strain ATCC 27775 / DSM 1100 / LMG 10767 / O) TaxID=760192 RepID=F4L7X1_HALH1|nr:restriction endonuclease subunit S [Haliscomenobacter hydrossis]AEE54479.1 restriction modification system DNA specificity domain protein [Haliscomenobacter hydrossis DSM 1100]
MRNWKTYKISDLCEVGRGSSPRPIIDQRFFEGGSIPWIKIADATSSGKYIYYTKEYVNEFGASFSRYLDKGSLIIAASGVSLGQIKFLGVRGCIHDGWLYISDYKKDLISKDFLYYFLIYYSAGFHNFSSGAAIQNINTEILRNTLISIPHLSMQNSIASILSNYDDLIEVNNQRIKLLEETARELYKEWFVRMRFPGWKETKFVKGVPEDWVYDTCYSFADIKGGGTPSTTNPEYWEGDINFFTPTDHSNSFFIFETEKKITEKGLRNSSTKMFTKYSTFITARGTVGNICLAGTDMAMNQSCFGIVSHNENDCFFTFLFTDEMIKYLKLVANGATFDAITLNTFKNYKALIPNTELRQLFFERTSPFFYQIENLLQQNTQLRQIRDRLLPRLISDKLTIKEP